jgi:hypothetical protein
MSRSRRLLRAIARWPVEGLVRVACVLALIALALMVWSVVAPGALPVVVGMSAGQGIGLAALGCYLLAVFRDAARRRRESLPPPAGEPSGPASSPPGDHDASG